MHLLDLLGGIPFCGEIRVDGLIHDGDKCDHVAERDVRRGPDGVNLVLLQAGVAQSDFLLIVDPILIVGPQAGVQNPLLKT